MQVIYVYEESWNYSDYLVKIVSLLRKHKAFSYTTDVNVKFLHTIHNYWFKFHHLSQNNIFSENDKVCCKQYSSKNMNIILLSVVFNINVKSVKCITYLSSFLSFEVIQFLKLVMHFFTQICILASLKKHFWTKNYIPGVFSSTEGVFMFLCNSLEFPLIHFFTCKNF